LAILTIRDKKENTARLKGTLFPAFGTGSNYLRRQGTPVPTNDIWIAATAAQHGFRLLTLDSHFLQIPQVMVDLIEPARRES
jgi:predicted nuclease of predicted toxin-antitoxin system